MINFLARGEVKVQLFFSIDVSAAFSTRLNEDTTIDDNPVVFGNVDLNIGDGCNESTGRTRESFS